MKKYRLKKWVVDALIIISFLLIILGTIDFENLLLQFFVVIISIIIIGLNTYLLNKYGNLENRKDI